MQHSSFEFLKRLLDAPGPSGFEAIPAGVWRAEAATVADEVDRDVTGNSYAWLRKPGAPVVVVEGHIDEIGIQITHIDADGYLWFDQIGGWDDVVFVGQRIIILAERGPVTGVIGRKAAHLIRREGGDAKVKSHDLWIDIGAKDRADARARVEVGDPGVIDAGFVQITDDLVSCRSLDNRVGAWVALETLRLLAADRPSVEVVALAAAQEEISFAGAFTATVRLAPLVGIAIDVTHATDYPNGDKKGNSEVKLGGGPVLTRGSSVTPAVYKGMRDAAIRLGLDLPVQGSARQTWTDADAMIRAGQGTAAGLISIPNRYMHSPNEMVSLSDLDACARVIAEFIRGIAPDADFRP
jgi:putative aminopeptidase FrvX